MSGFSERSERRVLPLWKNSRYAALTNEVQPLHVKRRPLSGRGGTEGRLALAARMSEFEKNPSLGSAADALDNALLSNRRDEVRNVAHFIEEHAAAAPSSLLSAARSVLGTTSEESRDNPRQAIGTLRRLLHIEPRNPILWVDLAREYSAVGKLDEARRAIKSALGLSEGNRWVCRMATRFLVHAGSKDEAHNLVLRHRDVKDDPWLLSAELALAQAAGRAPKYWSKAKGMLDSSLAPAHLSELACAVGTFEIASGNNKKAKKNFRAAMAAPSDNSLAQIKWAERTLRTALINDSVINASAQAYEARFWTAYYQRDMRSALKLAMAWRDEEPFSKRPAIMLSYIAAFLDDILLVQKASHTGLIANPDDKTLQLNLNFAKISALLEPSASIVAHNERASFDLMLKQLYGFLRDPDYAGHAQANVGLIFYRLGEIEQGHAAYTRASELAASNNDALQEATTRVFHAREAILARSSLASNLLEEAKSGLARAKSPGLEFYIAKLHILLANPERQQEILSPYFSLDQQGIEEEKATPVRFKLEAGKATIWLPPRKRSF